MIAIALSCDPKLLIADEPTTALDVTVQASVLDLLDDLRHEYEMSMIIITHDMGVVAEAADDIIVMYAGQVVEQASTLGLFDHPEHPYAGALLGALPQLEGANVRQGRLTAIGPAARPARPAARVPVRAALPYAGSDDCTVHEPQLREIRPGHWVRSSHPASRRAGAGAEGWAGEHRRRGSTESRESGRCRLCRAEAEASGAAAQGHGPTQALPDPGGPADRAQGGRGPGGRRRRLLDPAGETLGLVGESGSGKSTTGYCVLQLLKPTSGSVLFEGAELTELGREDIRRMRREMQIVFQDPTRRSTRA